jgi:hypothetical protein
MRCTYTQGKQLGRRRRRKRKEEEKKKMDEREFLSLCDKKKDLYDTLCSQ